MPTHYRTKTYIALDYDSDVTVYDKLKEWNNNERLGLSFVDVHDYKQSDDGSLPCSIKASLRERMNMSKRFVLIVGDKTTQVKKGGCQYCKSYNSYLHICARGHSVNYTSYIDYECEQAVSAGIDVVVLYQGIVVNRDKCPKAVRWRGTHIPTHKVEYWGLAWNYAAIRAAINQ